MQKEKNKAHPFAGILRPDEEILWWHTPQPLTWQEQWYMIKIIKNSSLGWLYTLQLLLNLALSAFQPKPTVLIAYGVTNRRLLKHTNNKIVGKPLNKFQIPTKIIYQGTRAMINLGRTSWWWINIETQEAERALQIIEQAKKQFKSLS